MKLKNIMGLALIGISCFLISSCADSASYLQQNAVTSIPGFFHGFWHGIIMPFAFICSLFSENVAIYAVNNTGGWYDFGFLLGAGGLGISLNFNSNE